MRVGVIASGLARNPTLRLFVCYVCLAQRAISGDAKRRHLYQDIARLILKTKYLDYGDMFYVAK